MKKVNIALVRVLQFTVFVLFTFMVLVYFSVLLLLPLDALAGLIALLNMIGFPGVVSAILALPVVGYLGWIIYQTPGLCTALVNIGVELALTGKDRVKQFEEIVASVKA